METLGASQPGTRNPELGTPHRRIADTESDLHYAPLMPEPQRVDVHVPFMAILKIVLSLLVFYCIVKLVSVLILLIIAILLAVMLEPLVVWLEGHHVRREIGVLAVGFVLIGLLVVFFAVILPATASQLTDLIKNLPAALDRIEKSIPAGAPWIRQIFARLSPTPTSPNIQSWMQRGMAAGLYAIEAVTAIILVLVVTIYLLVEGRQFYAWLVSYVPRRYRRQVAETAAESSKVVMAYMRGQVITCFLCGGWVFLMLLLLHVPGALPLAVVAFLADIIPVVGTIAMTVPGVLIALSVSPTAGALALLGYLLYHLVENYVIIPRVYGKQMRLSTLAVLLSVAIGGTLVGVAGAVLVLPFVAAYPIVERIWLGKYLAPETIEEHAEMHEEDADVKRVADEVLEKQ